MGKNMDNFKTKMLESDLNSVCELINVQPNTINQHKKDCIIANLMTYNMCKILDKSLSLVADGNEKFIIPSLYAEKLGKSGLIPGFDGKDIPVSIQLIFEKDGKTGIAFYIVLDNQDLLFLNDYAKELFTVMQESQIATLIKKESSGGSRKKSKHGKR